MGPPSFHPFLGHQLHLVYQKIVGILTPQYPFHQKSRMTQTDSKVPLLKEILQNIATEATYVSES